ncbi:hypothetical protein [Streptomyces sp. NPDC047718]|uniref:hypothetical protein n=1 Tax=Streptomyces sp. NPDC047718 TaxID=3155479 RepID=UPI0033CD0DFD
MSALGTSGWDEFYSSWVKPVAQILIPLVIALIVLISISGVLTRFMVRRETEAWPRRVRFFWAAVGGLSLFAVAAFLPLYPMLRPFGDGVWLTCAFWLVPALGVVLTVASTRVRASGLADGRLRVYRSTRGLPWPTFWLLMLVWVVLISCFVSWGEGNRLMVAYVALGLLGVTASATALGQSLRLQVEAQDAKGAVDAASTDYVLARLKSLGSKAPDGFGVPRASELSKLVSEDLSAIPAGAVAAAIARMMYVIRPDLTWRARITMVDVNRVTVALTRNGLHVNSTSVSRLDLGLPSIPPGTEEPMLEEEESRARAQLLTGAAACIIVDLSRAHPELKDGLCDSQVWKAVALQAIATEPALVGDPELRLQLLRSALNLEPQYGPARLDYLVELFLRTPRTVENRIRFAKLMDLQLELTEAPSETEQLVIRPGWEAIRLRILYSSAAMRTNAYLMAQTAGGQTRIDQLCRAHGDVLRDAADSANALVDSCNLLAGRPAGSPLAQLVVSMRAAGQNLGHGIALLAEAAQRRAGNGDHTWAWSAPTDIVKHPWPRLAHHYAALAEHAAENGLSRGELWDPLDYLAFWVATESDWQGVRGDPSFWNLLHDPVRAEKAMASLGRDRLGMLDLPPFAAHKALLRASGITTFRQLHLRTSTDELKDALADYLETSPIVIAHLTDIGELAASHDDLESVEVLQVLLDLGIGSLDELRHRRTADPSLRSALRAGAERYGLADLPAFRNPERWMAAADM